MANKRGLCYGTLSPRGRIQRLEARQNSAQTRALLGLFMSRAPLRIRGCLVAGERNKLAGLHQSVQCRMYHVFPEDVYS